MIVKEALANGRLTAKNDDPLFAEKRSLLEETAGEMRTTLDALTLAAVLAQPWADVVLSGAATSDQLQSNVNALNVDWNDDVRKNLMPLAEESATYWARRSVLYWN